jgi:hypothetical protein
MICCSFRFGTRRADDVRYKFEKYGEIRDVYLPKVSSTEQQYSTSKHHGCCSSTLLSSRLEQR